MFYIDGKHQEKCPKCKEKQTAEGYDPCLGKIPHVIAGCCGHGKKQPYLALKNEKGKYTLQYYKDEKALIGTGGTLFFNDKIIGEVKEIEMRLK